MQSHTVYRRLSWTHSQPTFELNYTLNKINEILVSGGLVKKKKSVAVRLENLHFKKFWPWTDYPAVTSLRICACIISRKVCLTCVSSGRRTLCGRWVYVVVSKTLSNHLIFNPLLYFMTIKATQSCLHTSELLFCLVCDRLSRFSVQSLPFCRKLFVYYTPNKRAGCTDGIQRRAAQKGTYCCWTVAMNLVLGGAQTAKTSRLLR